jgi:hypothetical protein
MIESPERKIAVHAQRIALEEAIRDRLQWRIWLRTTGRATFGRRWDDLEDAYAAEIKLLIRQLRRLRAR